MTKEIAEILLLEWENKKVFTADWDATCHKCEGDIQKGDGFVFYGQKQKLCNDCQAEVTETLEYLVEKAL